METRLVSDHFHRFRPPINSRSLPPLCFNPLLRPKSFVFFVSRTRRPSLAAVSCSNRASTAAAPADYGGWDDLELLDRSIGSGSLDLIRDLLVSVGICHGKQGWFFLLGFLAAFAVSRVKFSSVAILPVSAVVFFVGFSAGLARVGGGGGSSWDFDEKLGDFGDLLKELEVKLTDLRNGLEDGMVQNRFAKSKIRDLVDAIECIRVRIGSEQKAMKDPVLGDILLGHLGFDQGERKFNQKPRRRRRKLGAIASDLVEFFWDLLQENFTSLKQQEEEDACKKVEAIPLSESKSIERKDKSLASEMVDETSSDKSLENYKAEKPTVVLRAVKESSFENVQTVKMVSDPSYKHLVNGKKLNNCGHDTQNNINMSSYIDELDDLNTNFHYMIRQESYRKMVFEHKYGLQTPDEIHNDRPIDNPKELNDIKFSRKAEVSSLVEQTLEIHDLLDFQSKLNDAKNLNNKQASGKSLMEENTDKHSDCKIESEDQSVQQLIYGIEEGRVTADEEFDRKVKEASKILKMARESMKTQADEEAVDAMLHESAKLLSEAVDYKPMSLIAVGQLGNTYLLHGELKLKISRELRALLMKTDILLNKNKPGSQMKKLDIRILSRENVAAALSDVCEECEEFLIKAGRNYRMALEINGNDVKALYNWGLALSFRAGLIADVGPETAVDADKIFLAAIDKFDAIVSRSNIYAPDALYRWGLALQQRSYLRRQSWEKTKLLLQAKSLFEDILHTGSDNSVVKEALSSCLSELRYIGK